MIVRATEKNTDRQSVFVGKADADPTCAACGGSGRSHGPLDYPCLDNSSWCRKCEAGSALAEHLAGIVARTLGSTRTSRM